MARTKVGLVGSGNVSHMYLPVLTRISALEVAGVTDLDVEKAGRVAAQYGVPAVARPAELLADPTVDIVLNLTPIVGHVATTKAALSAGKHVYSEKPLATDVADGQSLLTEADHRGLLLGCAPDTLLGSGFQSAWQAIAAGRIGRPLGATTSMYRSELPAPSFYTEGDTPFFDMAPYYLTALVILFGPVRRVSAATRTWPAGAKPEAETPTGASISLSGVLQFESGAYSTLAMSWGTTHPAELSTFIVHGSTGTVYVPNPNNFGDPAYLQPHGDEYPTELPDSRQPTEWPANLRGLGVAELARAVHTGQRPRTSAELACHVVDLIAGLTRSGRTGEWVELTTSCTPPAPLSAEERQDLLG